jgi:hypothetical protein
MGETPDPTSAVILYTNIYRTYSNYVHAKYAECMDQNGGRPGRFHTLGMRETPKEQKAVEVLQTFIRTLSNAFVMMVQCLNLGRIVEADPVIQSWYDKCHEDDLLSVRRTRSQDDGGRSLRSTAIGRFIH